MRRIHCLFLLLALLCGCTASQEQEMVSDTVYGTVTEISDRAFVIECDDNANKITIPFDSDVMILNGNNCTTPSDIHMNDELMCTYTNGELTVIEIIQSENPLAE